MKTNRNKVTPFLLLRFLLFRVFHLVLHFLVFFASTAATGYHWTKYDSWCELLVCPKNIYFSHCFHKRLPQQIAIKFQVNLTFLKRPMSKKRDSTNFQVMWSFAVRTINIYTKHLSQHFYETFTLFQLTLATIFKGKSLSVFMREDCFIIKEEKGSICGELLKIIVKWEITDYFGFFHSFLTIYRRCIINLSAVFLQTLSMINNPTHPT